MKNLNNGDRVLFVIFFISGFCSLLYQVVWLRLAFAAFGVITPVLSVVVSVFMLGLAVGTYFGGRTIGWLTARFQKSALVFYAILELLIGIGAFVVPWLYGLGENSLLGISEMASSTYLFYSGLAIAIAILPWCIFMGATFPFMMAFKKESEAKESHSFSFLYLANVIGAMTGTILSALVFIELLGFSSTLVLAAFGNFAAAGMAYYLSRKFSYSGQSNLEETPDQTVAPLESTTNFTLICIILFLTGFVSLALEVVWTRAFTPYLLTTVYAFAALLATYLLATWLGSLRYRRHLERKSVLPTQTLMGRLAVYVFLPIVLTDPRLQLGAAGSLVSIFPFCFVLGYLTPKLIDEHSKGYPKRAGWAYSLNIGGGILGPLVAGYFLIPVIGVRLSMTILAIPFVILLAYFFKSLPATRNRAVIASLSALLLVFSLFVVRSFEDGRGGPVKRDHTATVIAEGEGPHRRLLVNGVATTHLTPLTKVMAHLPLAHLTYEPRSALVICFGMGTTFRSLASWDINVTAVELVPNVVNMFGYFWEDADEILDSPQNNVVIDDGRRFLKRSSKLFDVITIDPPPPIEAAGSSLLYSKEFYELIKQRLAPNGILQQWFPGGEDRILHAVSRALKSSFPHVRVFRSYEGWGYHYLASMKEIPALSNIETASRLSDRAKADLMEWFTDTSVPAFLQRVLNGEITPEEVLDPNLEWVLLDNQPINEYFVLRRIWRRVIGPPAKKS